MPVVLACFQQEAENRRITIQASLAKSETLFPK
jgi:hypothetical protein